MLYPISPSRFFRRVLILCFQLSTFSLSAQQPLMRDVFAAMPDSVCPLVTRNNRLDCIDFIENNMEARVRNVFDEYVMLEALTPDYARFRTSNSSYLELKLLHSGLSSVDTLTLDTATSAREACVLCIVRTAQTGEADTPRRLEDSTIRFLRPDWTPLDGADSVSPFKLPPPEVFVAGTAPDSLQLIFEQALRALGSFHPVRLALSADDVCLTAILQPSYLEVDERDAIIPHLRPLRFRWNGRRFVLENEQ